MKNCVICCEDTNEKNLFKCKNKECEMKQCCIDCMKRYLLESSKEPHCMSCHHAICTSDFISDFSKRWRLDVYKEHKKNILWAKEQSKMTETMELIRKQNKKNKIEGEITKLEQQIREFKMEIHRIDGRYVNEELSSKTKCINEYKYKCPKEDCNGFLDGNYNCAICDTNYCKDCFIVLQNDSKEHSCNEELKASIKKIKKDAKPCPNCGEMISKISGCDMMFCVKDNCGTSFNWRTGQVEKGLIHNPHAHAYYERHPEALEAYNNRMRELRTNRNERVDNCIVSVTDISTKIRTMGESISEKRKERKEQINYIINMIRNIYNFRNYTEVPVHKENTDLRIKWLKNESDELSVKRTLHMRFKKIEREILDHQILSTCATVINDLLRQMLDSKTNDEFYMIYNNDIQEIINYTNDELQANADYFSLKEKQINNEFKII
jgi:uncharacterized protein YeeX (DUF496 family)